MGRSSWLIALLLLASGLFHLLWLGISGGAWEGAVSLRKPALFGISTGLTVWSLGWVLTCFRAQPWERIAAQWVAVGLLIEVGLITLQYWRGVPSHFNEATPLDLAIERSMLALILIATGWIGWLSWRVSGPLLHLPAMNLAIRAGMWYLCLACVLGIATTVLGKWNLGQGRPYELWGQAGVLKFPHGVALHAIQFLPLGAWLAQRRRWPQAHRLIQGLVAAQLWLTLYALWQTWQGRGRLDVDLVAGGLLVAACLSVVWPLSAFIINDSRHRLAG